MENNRWQHMQRYVQVITPSVSVIFWPNYNFCWPFIVPKGESVLFTYAEIFEIWLWQLCYWGIDYVKYTQAKLGMVTSVLDPVPIHVLMVAPPPGLSVSRFQVELLDGVSYRGWWQSATWDERNNLTWKHKKKKQKTAMKRFVTIITSRWSRLDHKHVILWATELTSQLHSQCCMMKCETIPFFISFTFFLAAMRCSTSESDSSPEGNRAVFIDRAKHPVYSTQICMEAHKYSSSLSVLYSWRKLYV